MSIWEQETVEIEKTIRVESGETRRASFGKIKGKIYAVIWTERHEKNTDHLGPEGRVKKKSKNIPLIFKTEKEMDDYLENHDLSDLIGKYGIVKKPLFSKDSPIVEVTIYKNSSIYTPQKNEFLKVSS